MSVRRATSTDDLDVILATAASIGHSVIVAFTAATCDLCQQGTPAFVALAAAKPCGLEFVQCDIDVAPEAAIAFEIGALPTLKVFRAGVGEVGAMRGLANLDALQQLVERERAGQMHRPSAADSSERKEQRARERWQAAESEPSAQLQAQRSALAVMLADATNHERSRVALSTLMRLVVNVLESPAEAKYRTIKVENAAIRQKILSVPGAREMLLAVGFEHISAASPLTEPSTNAGPERFVLPDAASMAALAEARRGIETVLAHMPSGA